MGMESKSNRNKLISDNNEQKNGFEISYIVEKFNNSRLLFWLAVAVIGGFVILIYQNGLNYGLQHDNVYRQNNLIPLFNSDALPYNQSIYSLKVLGLEIPLMYKTYISSTAILRAIPIFLFSDYMVGMQVVNLFFLLTSILGSFTLIAKHHNTAYAFIFCTLVVLCPINYPMLLFHFLTWDHIFLFILSASLLYEYAYQNNRRIYLFWGVFIAFFSANYNFYNSWIIAAALVTFIVFDFALVLKIVKDIKNVVIIFAAAIMGLFNFVMYNFSNGFVTLKIFLENISNHDTATTIDFREKRPFFIEVSSRIKHLVEYISPIVLIVFLFLMVLFFILTFQVLQREKSIRKIILPKLFMTCLLFWLIVITPNANRPEHFIRLLPIAVLLFMDCCIVFLKHNRIRFKKILKSTASVILAVLIITIGVVDYQVISKSNKLKGTYNFSPAIFALYDTIRENISPEDDIICLEWGFMSQLYFLSKGQILADDSSAFRFMGIKDSKEIEREIFNTLALNKSTANVLYLPLYAVKTTISRNAYETSLDNNYISSDTNNTIYYATAKIVDKLGGTLETVQRFYENDGSLVMTLFRINDYQKFKENAIFNLYKSDYYNAIEFQSQITDNIDAINSHGVYEYSESTGGFWVQPTSYYVLNRKNEPYLNIRYYIPEGAKFTNDVLSIDVYIDNELIKTFGSVPFGLNEMSIEVPSRIYTDSNCIVKLCFSGSLIAEQDERSLAAVLSEIGFSNQPLENAVVSIYDRIITNVAAVDKNGNTITLNGSSSAVLTDKTPDMPITSMEMGLKLKVDDFATETVNIAAKKGEGWPNGVTFVYGWNGENVYIILSENGTDTDGVWLPRDTMPVGEWADVRIIFENRMIKYYVNDILVAELECGFGSLHPSNHLLVLGEGLNGSIKDFYLNYGIAAEQMAE